MPTYTVHAPSGEKARDPQRFIFVRDGFHFWAFVATPLWLIAKRLWLVLVLYVVLSLAVAIVFVLLGTPAAFRYGVELLLAVLVGLESGTLQRWTYARRKWVVLGVVVADNEEAAERQFFTRWIAGAVESPGSPAPSSRPAAPLPRRPAPDIIGLFPLPGPRP